MFNRTLDNFTELVSKKTKQEENPNPELQGILGDVDRGRALAYLPTQLSKVGGINKLTRALVT